MDNREHLFIKLMEECAEVQQRVSKLLQFGPDEAQPGNPHNNLERLRHEINDMLSIVSLLEDAEYLPILDQKYFMEWKAAKAAKLEHFRKYSEKLGLVR